MKTIKERIEKNILAWKEGKISNKELKEWAESLNDSKLVNFDESGGLVIQEVLKYLEDIDMNLTIKEDLDACLKFLKTKKHDFDKGYDEWSHYLDTIDYKARKKQLSQDPFYSKFCK